MSDARRFFILRHPTYKHHFFGVLLIWAWKNFPELRGLFDIRDAPCEHPDWSRYALHHAWLQDPVQGWCQATYDHASTLAAECDQRGVPVINRVDRLVNATKSTCQTLLSQAGIRMPRMARIENPEEFRETLLGMPLPLFVREDWGHSGTIRIVEDIDEARRIPLEEFTRPIAVEWIDASSPKDGLYHKRRYVVAGDKGVSHHVHVSSGWVTRGSRLISNDATRDEELAYIAEEDPHRDLFQRARQALGLDLLAFDYGFDRSGRMVVWEANPFPNFRFSTRRRVYRNHAMHMTLGAIFRLYLQRASLPVPERLEQLVRY